MAQDVTLMGATYQAVPAVELPKAGGGTARYDDASVTTATAADVLAGKLFLAADGTITTGTGSGGGGAFGTLIKTQSLGRLTYSSTSELDTGQTVTVTGINDYDMLVFLVSADVVEYGRLIATINLILLNGQTDIGVKNTTSVSSARQTIMISDQGQVTSRGSTSAYGIYTKSATPSSGSVTLPVLMKYSSTYTGPINSDFTVYVYAINIRDLIGV